MIFLHFLSRCVFVSIFFFNLNLSAAVVAQKVSAIEIKFLEKSRKVFRISDLQSLKREYRELRILSRSCELQIARQTFPFDCFSAQKLAEKWGVPFAMSLEEIETRCSQASVRGSPFQRKNFANVSATCLKRWNEATLDREYSKKTTF